MGGTGAAAAEEDGGGRVEDGKAGAKTSLIRVHPCASVVMWPTRTNFLTTDPSSVAVLRRVDGHGSTG